ncbi:MAG TPA: M23 family metallopeptidase [Baekduia sp.]|nr:M23 family metallopeptidase [Baekduia sp.]
MPRLKITAVGAALLMGICLTAPAAGAKTTPAVAKKFSIAPQTFTTTSTPSVTVRLNKKGVKSLRARLVFTPRKHGKRTTINIGSVATNRTIQVTWPAQKLAPGRYTVKISVAAKKHVHLMRTRRAPGTATVVVQPPPPVSAGPITAGVFPLTVAHTYGDGFGVSRGDHVHEGQDVFAPAGSPIVAPVAGTIASTSYQASGAGEYIVMNAADGRAFMFAHLIRGSTAVVAGQPVAAGQPIGQVGQTGDASGPHLHFEIWLNGWYASPASAPIDPLPQLQFWDK